MIVRPVPVTCSWNDCAFPFEAHVLRRIKSVHSITLDAHQAITGQLFALSDSGFTRSTSVEDVGGVGGNGVGD